MYWTSIINFKREGVLQMKKEYEAPKAEMLEFDYTDVVTASGAKSNCMIAGQSFAYEDAAGNKYTTYVPGN